MNLGIPLPIQYTQTTTHPTINPRGSRMMNTIAHIFPPIFPSRQSLYKNATYPEKKEPINIPTMKRAKAATHQAKYKISKSNTTI